MTTPAKSFTARKRISSTTFYIRPWDPHAGESTSFLWNGELYVSRPESANGVFIGAGPSRLPTAWNHEGGYSTMQIQSHHQYGELFGGFFYAGDYNGASENVSTKLTIGAFDDYVVERCVNGLLDTIKNQNINLGQAFAERQQTVDLVTDILRRVVGKISDFKRLKGRKFWRQFLRMQKKQPKVGLARLQYQFPSTLPNHVIRKSKRPRRSKRLTDETITRDWLAFQYGLRPLMGDAYGAMYALNAAEREDDFYRSDARSKKAKRTNVERTDLYGLGHVSQVAPITRVTTFDGMLMGVNFTIDNPLTTTLSSLGITNPLNLAWELLPFSFVWDWWQPVGSYLNLLDATRGWKFLSGYHSKVQRLEAKVVGVRQVQEFSYANYTYNNAVHIFELEKAQTRLFKFRRTILGSFPGPVLPAFKNPITLGHFANASALLVQLLK